MSFFSGSKYSKMIPVTMILTAVLTRKMISFRAEYRACLRSYSFDTAVSQRHAGAFKPLVSKPMTAPIVPPVERKTGVIFENLFDSFQDRPRSFSSRHLSLQRRQLPVSFSILPSAAFLSAGEVFSSWMIAWPSPFWPRTSFSCSFKSSTVLCVLASYSRHLLLRRGLLGACLPLPVLFLGLYFFIF